MSLDLTPKVPWGLKGRDEERGAGDQHWGRDRSRAGSWDSPPAPECLWGASAEPLLCCLTARVLQESYPRNYFKFYRALWDYFWLLCETSQVMSGLCRVGGWHRGHESQEDLRKRQCGPLKESCFLFKKPVFHTCKRNIFQALFPYSMLKFPNFVCECGDCSCMGTEQVKGVIKSGHFCVVSVCDESSSSAQMWHCAAPLQDAEG